MFEVLTKDPEVYVRIKAANLFLKFGRVKSNRDFLKPIIYECCTISLKLSEEFWIEDIPSEIGNMFSDYEELLPLAPEIFQQLQRVCMELWNNCNSAPGNEDSDQGIDREFTIENCLRLQC